MKDDLKTRIKELKEELELLEKATDAEDKTREFDTPFHN